MARGADAAITVDRPRDELAAAIAAEGPYDLIADYLWGPPAEAAFAALTRPELRGGDGPRRIRYILVGMTAGEVADAAGHDPARRTRPAGRQRDRRWWCRWRPGS
jgi:hypothetical protein